MQNDLLSNRAHIACRFTIAINMIIIYVFLWTRYVLVRLYGSFDFSNSSQGNFTICADENPSTDEKLPSVEIISLFCLLRRIKNAELLTAEILLFINTQKLKISSRSIAQNMVWAFNLQPYSLPCQVIKSTEIAGEFLCSVCFTIVFTAGFSGTINTQDWNSQTLII